MSDTQAILRKIAALRARLEPSQAPPIGSAAAETREGGDPLRHLAHEVAVGARHNAMIDSTLRQLSAAAAPENETPLPARRLTARGARLLQLGRESLRELRQLADEPLLQADEPEPLTDLYQQTAAMLDTVLRTVPAFPDAPSAQARLCDGLEGVLDVVTERVATLKAGLGERRRQTDQVERLTAFLSALAAGHAPELTALRPLADELVAEAAHEWPLHVPAPTPATLATPARLVACHSLTVAQVIARLGRGDAEWYGRPHEPVLAALLHDAGMVRVPADILNHAGPLNDEQRRRVEHHTREGAHLLERTAQGAPWLIEAAVSHHERSDGTGYPAGLLETHLSPLVRLLIVCDVYAALLARRPYRAALEPRAALTDTLLLADQGAIDRVQAERLLRISFYPVGSIVELSDGSSAVVVGPPPAHGERIDPSRPLVSLVTDKHGMPCPMPRHVDLTREGQRSVLRQLPTPERRELLGKRYPALV
jgi:HD-GYP domain-containing protein (c-di-GMP phosphodiesterase class II)